MTATINRPGPQIVDPMCLGDLKASFRRDREPIQVNFRKMVSWPSYPERGTHLIHPYPAKLLAHIPFFLLGQSTLSERGDRILDPFCGSGTVLLEGMLAGREVVGADSNPLARLIAGVKTTVYDETKLRSAARRLLDRIEDGSPEGPLPDVVNLEHWFYPHVIRQLTQIANAVHSCNSGPAKDFFQVCFSACVRRVSLADPRNAVPVRLRPEQFPKRHWLHAAARTRLNHLRRVNVIAEFGEILEANLARASSVARAEIVHDRALIAHDARSLVVSTAKANTGKRLRAGSVRLIITSPPYAGAQKYIRSSSLSLGWLGMCGRDGLRQLEDANIGREHFPTKAYLDFDPTGVPDADKVLRGIAKKNALRAHIAGTYLKEMKAVLTEMVRVLAPSGHLALVAGNNMVCGKRFRTAEYLATMAEGLGLERQLVLVDDIRSRGLMTKRNRTADVITQEWVYLLRKPA
jgi:hypothetical protein